MVAMDFWIVEDGRGWGFSRRQLAQDLCVVAQAVMRMAFSVWLTCSTEQPGRSGNNARKDINSFLGRLEMLGRECPRDAQRDKLK